jgi:ABC-type transport system substrate-binding protein
VCARTGPLALPIRMLPPEVSGRASREGLGANRKPGRSRGTWTVPSQGVSARHPGCPGTQSLLLEDGQFRANSPVFEFRYVPDYSRPELGSAAIPPGQTGYGDGVLEYGAKRLPFELTVFTARGNSVREKLAQAVLDNLAKAGIRVGIQQFLPNELVSRFLDSFEYEAVLFGFTPTDVAPDLQTDLWYSSGKTHFWCPNQETPQRPWEATMDSLISNLVRTLDPSVRKSTFDQVQDIWAEQMPAIPAIAPNILVGWNRRLGNVRPSIMRPHLIWNIEEICKK